MKAQYPGVCKATGKRYGAGAEIEKGPYGWQIAGTKAQDRTVGFGERSMCRGSGSGGEAYTEGDIFLDPEDMRYLVVRAAWQEYYREDGLSFGVGDDAGYLYFAVCRVATVTEYMPVWETEQVEFAKQSRRKDAKRAIERLFVHEDGVYEFQPDGQSWRLDGRWVKIGKGFDIYGSGEEICVTKKHIWRCHNNGMDGDNWSRNNVQTGGAGAIGYRFASTPERLAALAEYEASRINE
jgi:hypothetical protein